MSFASWTFKAKTKRLLLVLAMTPLFALPARHLRAQVLGTVVGTVVTESGQPVPSASIVVEGTETGALSNTSGEFRLQRVAPGTYVVSAHALGYRTATAEVEVVFGETVPLKFVLRVRPIELGGIAVEVLRPDLAPRGELSGREVRESNPKDAGQLLRELEGVDAVRRGPIGLDPVVRGLRETEVGTYLDGTRLFPAGPARMDSPLTHLDPSAVSTIEVIKGPYALTWGAGNLSAIRLTSAPLPQRGDEVSSGSFSAGYDSNLDASELTGSTSARRGRVSFLGHGAWREGNDYETGAGIAVPSDFLSWEGRGRVGLDIGDRSLLALAVGYQWQEDLDYPGRVLNADYFRTVTTSLDFRRDQAVGVVRTLEAAVYRNHVDHGMGNWQKPTATMMNLDIDVESQIEVWGGRLSADLAPGPWMFKLGSDVYTANRDATRTIRNSESGMQMGPTDLMWPDVTIMDAGAYLRVGRSFGSGLRFDATIRVDEVSANADTATQFFVANVSDDLEAVETNLSGAVTAGLGLGTNWDLSLGVGSAVRTADATERYSDRIPASKAQMSAEFVGNPQLDPERSNQADLWLEGTYSRTAVQLNVFGRVVEDYITLEATDLPKRLPLSPDVVFQYRNGAATFYGGEASVAYALTSVLTADLGAAYLWGEESLIPPGQTEEVHRAALGIAPKSARAALRYEDLGGRFFLEGAATAVADQERVSVARNEMRTPGYSTFDVQGGVVVGRGWYLRLGAQNLLDREYADHLNARNPFAAMLGAPSRVPEPGRVLYIDVTYAF